MFYTYIIRSIPLPQQRYIGYTSDLKQRMEAHNYGEDKHTAPYKPRKLETYIAFDSVYPPSHKASEDASRKARAFERYLKSGSGHAFASRHF